MSIEPNVSKIHAIHRPTPFTYLVSEGAFSKFHKDTRLHFINLPDDYTDAFHIALKPYFEKFGDEVKAMQYWVDRDFRCMCIQVFWHEHYNVIYKIGLVASVDGDATFRKFHMRLCQMNDNNYIDVDDATLQFFLNIANNVLAADDIMDSTEYVETITMSDRTKTRMTEMLALLPPPTVLRDRAEESLKLLKSVEGPRPDQILLIQSMLELAVDSYQGNYCHVDNMRQSDGTFWRGYCESLRNALQHVQDAETHVINMIMENVAIVKYFQNKVG